MTSGAATTRVASALKVLAEVNAPEIWITLANPAALYAAAEAVDARVDRGERLPLAGLVFAVKDNIDVAGMPTTAGCPSFSYTPQQSATAVRRLGEAGALVLGKANLDQFATGLVGTRSPYGAVRCAFDPERIAGGSSSGSAAAVAHGIVDFSLGTDTAGSGRVPAALNGIVGVKPTRGLMPVTGVVPASYSLDCVSVFARDLTLARLVAELMSGPDAADPLSREARPEVVLPPVPRVAVPTSEYLDGMASGWRDAFAMAAGRLGSGGVEIVEVDIAPLLEAAQLLYGGAFVAERHAAIGSHIESHRDLIGSDIDPTVAAIILDGASPSAAQWARDAATLARLGAEGRALLDGCDALLTPTTTCHPTLQEVAADPTGVNSRLGRFTNFANLLDLAALAVPTGTVDGLPFGVMFTGPAFSDRALADLARRLLGTSVDLFVVGAHLSGHPLNIELVQAGGTLLRHGRTAPSYQLHALDTVPRKPGLVRVREGGSAIDGEIWRLPAAGFGSFVSAVPAPMAIGKVELLDGSNPAGFLVEPYALEGADHITPFGGWRGYLASLG